MFLLGLAVVGVMEHFTVMRRMRAHERSIRNNRSNYSKLVGTFVGARQKIRVPFPYYFRTGNKKGLGISAKSLNYQRILVGGGGFEPPTPAV